MRKFGRRRFLHVQTASLAAAVLASCRKIGWFDGQEPTDPEHRDRDGALGLPQPDTEQTSSANTSIKDTARADYHQSFLPYGGKLSNDPSTLSPYYDVVIVGSGYGAAITAARLAPHLKQGKTICIIERGREWVPGEFPDTFSEYLSQVTAKNPLGVYDFRFGNELDVIQGSGLGGTSLINASTAAIPDPEVFLSPKWPTALRNLTALMPYYLRALKMLGAAPTPPGSTGKARMMRYLAERFPSASKSFVAAEIAVTTAQIPGAIVNDANVTQRVCTFCGDCISGCNVGAKNTLVYNYLPLAKRAGTQIFSELSILDVRQEGAGFALSYIPTSLTKRNWWDFLVGATRQPVGLIRANVVILGAGSLGSTGILLRSRGTLPMSHMLGQRFSSNGDVFAVYKDLPETELKDVPNIGGKGAHDSLPGPGPTIQTITRINANGPLEERVILEDLCVPRAFVPSYELATRSSSRNGMFLLGMGHDGADGSIILDRFGQPVVSWPGILTKPFYAGTLRMFTTIKAIFMARIPWWDGLLMRLRQETAHPLGGCAMADTPDQGVVNDRNQVFRPNGSVYPNLYVIDGSVIPTSLGINPLLTISALAERAAELIITEQRHPDIFS